MPLIRKRRGLGQDSGNGGDITEIAGTFPGAGSPTLFNLPPVYTPTSTPAPPVATVPNDFGPVMPTISASSFNPSFILIAGAGLFVLFAFASVLGGGGRRR